MKKPYYTIYLNKTDEVVATGTAEECRKQLDLKSKNCLHSLVSKSVKGRRNKYTVVKEFVDDL